MKTFFALLPAALSASVSLATAPQLTVTSFDYNGATIKVDYSLSRPAIVTFDVLTNVTGTAEGDVFASVGGRAFRHFSGDVFKKVTASSGSITWKVAKDLAGVSLPANSVKVEVKAWGLDDPPDYLVVNMDNGNSVNYYPSEELMPFAVSDDICKWKKLPMRRIRARGVEWTMGTTGERGRYAASEKAHRVTLDHDYYIGVYELTVGHYGAIRGWTDAKYSDVATRAKPLNNYPYDNLYGSGVHYPNAPTGELKSMNDRLGGALTFDLPSEAEWEFAARGGHIEDHWGNGDLIAGETTDAGLSKIAHYIGTNPSGWSGSFVDVGSYEPNDYGLYDMNGNLREWCLDWYQADITWNADGRPNADGLFLADGVTPRVATDNVVARGGGFASNAKDVRGAFREGVAPNKYQNHNGIRLVSRIVR